MMRSYAHGAEGESSGNKYQRSLSMPQTPTTPTTPTASSPTPRQGNVWRSVFNPGSNLATKTQGANLFDKPQPNSPTVYDWYHTTTTLFSSSLPSSCTVVKQRAPIAELDWLRDFSAHADQTSV
ncbi:hypothetical protein B296_00032857 [Ensete ventricosum]|uniref:Uncharacterized protein n=1 Tax=Ensete ventricosum TaxID=4639 RepID=A0A427A0F8_ENSVE|nr:hypothetical protein B296_00032857 [Ensete ventricosum]